VAAERHTDTLTRVTTIHFTSSTTHAKCNNLWKIMKLRTEIKISRPELNVSYSRFFFLIKGLRVPLQPWPGP